MMSGESSGVTSAAHMALYLQNAAAAASEAAETNLPLVRERALRVEARWREMADTAERVDEEHRRRVAATNARMGR